ncbi:UNVERIFIED_CONTAM: hypothetical protein PYX00_001508 [Menopon gallinae]|uniref:Uncharacterized protein n=1 Tax=Menopon gallinae TaxID=328185 RepID=A0AAW2IED4_9NEOP
MQNMREEAEGGEDDERGVPPLLHTLGPLREVHHREEEVEEGEDEEVLLPLP